MDGEMSRDLLLELNNLKAYTLRIIEVAENKEYEALNELFENRSKIIEKIEKLEYTMEAFKTACDEVGLLSIEEKMNLVVKAEYIQAKQELEKFLDEKNAKRLYTNGSIVDSIYFNKKI